MNNLIEMLEKQRDKFQAIADSRQVKKTIKCPKCGSTEYISHSTYSKTKGILGAAIIGPVGLVAGAGSNKLQCTKCRKKWRP